MKLRFITIMIMLNIQNILYCQIDSVKQKRHFYKMNISVGSNVIKSQNFNYKYIVPDNIRDGTNKDYQITNFYTVSPTISLAYSRLLNTSKKYLMYLDVESSLYLNTEKYHAKGSEENNFGKSQVEFTIVNYFSGYNTSLNFTLLKDLIRTKMGFFIGVGAGSLVYRKQYIKRQNYTNNETIEGAGDEVHFENIQFNVNFGLEYRYMIGQRNFSSRLYMCPQISKTQLMSYKYFEFNNRNYLTFFSTAIIL
jgi:hypothetical protein